MTFYILYNIYMNEEIAFTSERDTWHHCMQKLDHDILRYVSKISTFWA